MPTGLCREQLSAKPLPRAKASLPSVSGPRQRTSFQLCEDLGLWKKHFVLGAICLFLFLFWSEWNLLNGLGYLAGLTERDCGIDDYIPYCVCGTCIGSRGGMQANHTGAQV